MNKYYVTRSHVSSVHWKLTCAQCISLVALVRHAAMRRVFSKAPTVSLPPPPLRSERDRLERPSCRVGIAPTEEPHLFTAHGQATRTDGRIATHVPAPGTRAANACPWRIPGGLPSWHRIARTGNARPDGRIAMHVPPPRFLEQTNMYNALNLSLGMEGPLAPLPLGLFANSSIAGTKINSFQCPSDRSQLFQINPGYAGGALSGPMLTKGNYGVSFGNTFWGQDQPATASPMRDPVTGLVPTFMKSAFGHYKVTFASVTDGLSNTAFGAEVLEGDQFDIRGVMWSTIPGGGSFFSRMPPTARLTITRPASSEIFSTIPLVYSASRTRDRICPARPTRATRGPTPALAADIPAASMCSSAMARCLPQEQHQHADLARAQHDRRRRGAQLRLVLSRTLVGRT